MKILYIGDFIKKNGPSIVDLNYRKYLAKTIKKSLFFQATNYKELPKLIADINKYDYIIISGVSFTGALVVFIAKSVFNKPVYYICHGLLKYESKFTKVNMRRFAFEKIIMNNSKSILAVSNLLKEKLSRLYKINHKKVQVQYNGIEFINWKGRIKKRKYTLLSVGGGRRQKRILNICKAIQRSNYKDRIKFIVVGEDGEDTHEIKKFKFVQYLGFIPREKLINVYQEAEIFLLLSTFDSFSSSFFEALQCKCSIITSQNIGVLELFPDELREQIIVDGDNIELLSKKIDSLLRQPNYDEIYNYCLKNYKRFSWRARTEELLSKLKK